MSRRYRDHHDLLADEDLDAVCLFVPPFRPLGRTDLQVTPLGIGGAQLERTPDGFDDALAARTVHEALQAGINLIDTAPIHGDDRRRIGLSP